MARKERSSRRSSKKGSVVSVNFKGVETRVVVEPDTYKVSVSEVTREEGDKAEYFKWKFSVIENADGEDEFEGAALYLNTSLLENSLWNLKGLLQALGEDVPNDEMDIDLEDMVDKECMVVVEHDEYEGRPQAKVVDYSPVEEKSSKKKRSKKDKDDADDDDDKKDKKSRKSRKDDAEDEDEDDKKSSKKKRGKKDKDKVKQSDVQEMSQDELEECVEEHSLDVDLGDFKTLKKMCNAVIDALEKEDLLDDDE